MAVEIAGAPREHLLDPLRQSPHHTPYQKAGASYQNGQYPWSYRRQQKALFFLWRQASPPGRYIPFHNFSYGPRSSGFLFHSTFFLRSLSYCPSAHPPQLISHTNKVLKKNILRTALEFSANAPPRYKRALLPTNKYPALSLVYSTIDFL